MENNRFELVFNELTDGAELKSLPIDDIAMNGIIEEEEMEDEGSENDGDDEYNAWKRQERTQMGTGNEFPKCKLPKIDKQHLIHL